MSRSHPNLSRSKPHFWESPRFVIPFITFSIGFLPMVVLSLKIDSFWLTSEYDFPLVTIVSVLIGDSLLIPWINLRTYKLWVSLKERQQTPSFVWLGLLYSVVLFLSLTANAITHSSWVRDPYSGFMDIEQGKLTTAGWWHFGFSTVEMSVFMFIIILTFLSFLHNNYRSYIYGFRTLVVMALFTLLSLFDFLIRNFYILRVEGLGEALTQDWTALITIPLAIILLTIGRFGVNRLRAKALAETRGTKREMERPRPTEGGS